MGVSNSLTLGMGPLSVGGSTDISTNTHNNYTYGKNWNTFSIGLGIGLPVSGSTQVSVSKPLLIYPSLNTNK